MDTNKLIDNTEILNLLDRLKAQFSAELEYELYKQLLSTKFLSPLTEDSLNGSSIRKDTLNEESMIKFISLKDQNGNDYLPVFTDWNELKKWNKTNGIKTQVLTFVDYKAIIKERNSKFKGFVLNPASHNIIFDRDLIDEVCRINDESVMIGIPEKYPHEMVEALQDFLTNIKDVKRAYLLLMIRGGTEKSYLLVVESKGNINDIFRKLAKVVSKYLVKDELVDFVSLSQPFGKSAVEGQKPFYEKIK